MRETRGSSRGLRWGAALLLVLGGCGEKSAGGPGGGGGAAGGPVQHVLLLETNRDTFPRSLGEHDGAEDEVVLVADGALHIATHWAEETDAAELAEAGIVLHDAGVPLGRCRLIVEHRIVYAGRARWGTTVEVHGFAGDAGTVTLPAAPSGAELLVDPAAPDGGPASSWAWALRAPPTASLAFSTAAGGLSVALGSDTRRLGAGEELSLPARTVALRVREREVPWSEVDPGTEGGAPLPGAFLVAVDHGRVELSTSLTVRFSGSVTRAAGPASSAGLGEEEER